MIGASGRQEEEWQGEENVRLICINDMLQEQI